MRGRKQGGLNRRKRRSTEKRRMRRSNGAKLNSASRRLTRYSKWLIDAHAPLRMSWTRRQRQLMMRSEPLRRQPRILKRYSDKHPNSVSSVRLNRGDEGDE